MKIIIDAHLSENNLTGIGRYLNELIPALLSIDQTNEYTILLNSYINQQHPLYQLKKNNLKKIFVTLTGPSLKQHFIIPALLRKIKPDIYHHPHFDLPLGIRTRAVITVHDLKYIHHPEYFSGNRYLKKCYMFNKLKHSIQRSKQVIAISSATKNDLISHFQVDHKKIQVIHHGNTSLPISGNRSDYITTNYNINHPYILFVGERRPHKNIVNLIKAFKLLCESYSKKIDLVIIGKRYADYQEPENVVNQFNLNNQVHLFDTISDDELSLFYKNAEFLILPSCYEGFGLPLIEAMNYGIPVLGSDKSSIPEIMGDAGILFDPDNIRNMSDKMRAVLTNNRLKMELIKKGQNRVLSFTWEKTAEQTLEVYRSILKQ